MKAILAVAVIAGLACSSPAYALSGQPPSNGRRTGTIVKWVVIGAAAGFATGFLLGMRAYDDATYAERKIMNSGLAGAAIGGVAGGLFGRHRARSTPTPAIGQTFFKAPPIWRPVVQIRYPVR